MQLKVALADQAKFVICYQSIEQDHRFIKRRVKPGLGFASFRTAWCTLRGYESLHMIRKGQVRGVARGDVGAQSRFIARLFGIAA